MSTFNVGPNDVNGLIEAIEDAISGDVIELSTDSTYTLLTPYLSTNNGLPVINSEIVINGHGAVIQRDKNAPNFRIFEVTASGSLALNDVTVKQGQIAGDGGAIYSEGQLTITDSTLSENTTLSAPLSYCNGGAICQKGTPLTLTNTSILTNTADGEGGGIYYSGDTQVILEGCTISENTSLDVGGGGLCLVGDNSTPDFFVTDCTISKNTAPWRGGGLRIEGNLTIDGSTIVENESTSNHGGGISQEYGDLIIRNSQVSRNTSSGLGGGLWFRADEIYSLTITDSQFRDNSAGSDGGGIWHNMGPVVVERSVISGNSCEGWGGGINNIDSSPLTIRESEISYNACGGAGGGIEHASSPLLLYACDISHNTSEGDCGGIDSGSNDVQIQYCKITDNRAVDEPAGLYFDNISTGDSVHVNYCQIAGNQTTGTQNQGVVNDTADNTEIDATYNWWGAEDGPGGEHGTGSGDGISNYVNYEPFFTLVRPLDCECPIGWTLDALSSNPVGLLDGDKREQVTDLAVNTPNGPLALIRSYKQSEQANNQFMGLGWTHNHAMALTFIPGTPNRLKVRLANGGEAAFRETTTNHYVAAAGSASYMDRDSGTGQYTLTAGDTTKYIFDDDDVLEGKGKLLQKVWPNGDVWDYSYDGDNLTQVEDEYGNRLVFRYENDQLKWVGDQTFDDADPQNPTGRFVEYHYVLNKVVDTTGTHNVINGSAHLLTEVVDVRGETWTYVYYDQTDQDYSTTVPHPDIRQLNYLVKRQSPPLNGNALVLEEVTYTMQGEELVVNGDMEEADSGWSNVGTPPTNARSTTKKDSGTYSRYVVSDAPDEGIESVAWTLEADQTYVIRARVYPVSGTVKMQVPGITALSGQSQGTGAWETLTATYTPTTQSTGNTLQFVALGGNAEFYVDTVCISTTGSLDINGGMELDSGWSNVGTPPTNARSTTKKDSGTYSRYVVSDAPDEGIESAAMSLLASQTYTIRACVYPENGTVEMRLVDSLGVEIPDTVVFSKGVDAWESLSLVYIPSSNRSGVHLQFLSSDGTAEFYVDTVLIDLARVLAINGDMEADNGWTALTGANSSRSNTYAAKGSYSRQVNVSTADAGIQSSGTGWTLRQEDTYIAVARVRRDTAAQVKMRLVDGTGSEISGASVLSSAATGWETLRVVYQPSADVANAKLQFLANGGTGLFYVDDVSVLETDLSVKAIEQARGNGELVTAFDFQPVGANYTTETQAGLTQKHQFTMGLYAGMQDATGHGPSLVPNTQYRATSQQDANSNQTLLDWSSEGKLLHEITDALEDKTSFDYDLLDRLWASRDAQGRQTTYVYDGEHRQPTLVLIGALWQELDINGGMEVDSNWADYNNPSLNERSTAQVESGSYSRHVKAGSGAGIESATFTLYANRTYLILARVYLVKSPVVKLTVTGGTGFDVLCSSECGTWQTLRAIHTMSSSEAGSQTLRFLAQNTDAEFYVDSVSVYETGELDINGSMEMDSGWSDVGSPTLNSRVIAQVGSGDHARHVSAPEDAGIQSTAWTLEADQTYVIRARVYPVSGTVKMQVPGVTALAAQSQGTGAWETLTATYTPTTQSTGNTLQFVALGDSAEFYVDTVSISTMGSLDINGGMELDSGWSSVETPTTNTRSSVKHDSETYSRYIVTDAADEGIESAAMNLLASQTYTIRARVYPESGVVKMWLVDSLGVEIPDTADVSKGVDAWESLSLVYTPSSNQSGVQLQFLSSGAAEFYVDTVSVDLERMLSINGDMEADSGWSNVGIPSLNERCARVESGTYMRHVTTDDANEGIESAAFSLEQDHTYLVMGRVYLAANKAVTMTIPSVSAFDAISSTSVGAWQTLRAIHQVTAGEAGSHTLRFVASLSDADFDVDSVHLLDLGVLGSSIADEVRWQEFAYDAKGRTLAEQAISPVDASVLQETTRSYYAFGVGAGLLQQIVQHDLDGINNISTTYTYDAAGRVIRTQKNTTFGSCRSAYTVYDAAGNVLASICNYDPGYQAAPRTAEEAAALYDASAPDNNHVTTYGYDELGRRVSITANAGTDQEQTSLTFYDALNRVWRTIANYQPQASSAPGSWTWNGTSQQWERAGEIAISHGSDLNENIISDTDYNDRGQIRLRRDVLGNVMLYGYDAAGRLVKTVQNASIPDYNNNYNSGTNPDPDLSAYSASTTVDEDIISTSDYDAVGNLVKSVGPSGSVTFTVYDALNRAIKTVRNAKEDATIALNPGDTGYEAANDPRSDDYEPSAEPDRDQLDLTVYDTMGRVQQTKRLVDTRGASAQWSTTYQVYDELDRPVRTIANYVPQGSSDPASWTWEGDHWEYPEEQTVAHGNNDQNLITETVYDSAGRVQYTLDINRNKTWQVYDGLGRTVKTVVNYTASSDPADWVWDTDHWKDGANIAINHGDNDENIISATTYDSDGRVQETRDVMGNRTRLVYDDLGRQVKTIANYAPPVGADDPSNWVWVTDRWEDGSSVVIPRGDNADLNIISETVYDDQGRVFLTRDVRGNIRRPVYDDSGRQVRTVTNYLPQGNPETNPANWTWAGSDWEYATGLAVTHGNSDQNLIADTSYDLAGRVFATRDTVGLETRVIYDKLGRRVRTITNYMESVPPTDPANWVWHNNQWEDGANNPIQHGDNDQNLISDTVYNKVGQVISTRDVRGTQTAFVYDQAGRRVQVIQAVGTPLETTSYTCYNKAGQVLRSIDNWVDNEMSPNEMDSSGSWVFAPAYNGVLNDENRIAETAYDLAGRRTTVTDPVGNTTTTTYFKNGQVDTVMDPMGMISLSRYDKRGRRTVVVQGYNASLNDGDPASWLWDAAGFWKEGDGTPIVHSVVAGDNDQNVIVQVAYDLAGRMLSRRDPRGNLTSYSYDQMGRRTELDMPKTSTEHLIWTTAYDEVNGAAQVTLTDPMTFETQRSFDRLGRVKAIDYLDESPKYTPDVIFSYDVAGNRTAMTEHAGATNVRITSYDYNDARRLTNVDFDVNGNGSVIETVSYTYDRGGLRTQLTMPDSLQVEYIYNQKGRLVSLTDWDNHETRFAYDNAGRMVETKRPNGLRSRYAYDAGGRLRLLHHGKGKHTFARFTYEVDGRGNRTQAQETLAHPATLDDTLYTCEDDAIVYHGIWNTVGDFRVTTQYSASLQLMFFGQEAVLTMGTGTDHSIFDIYVDHALWRSFDGYPTAPNDLEIPLLLEGDGPHLLELRNRAEKHLDSSAYTLRFKQLLVPNCAYDLQTIEYTYDALSRLKEARYNPGMNTSALDSQLLRRYQYSYDLAGNRLQEIVTVAGTATTTNRTYNAANQIIGFDYDANGNLADDGPNTYVWDRANRLLSMGGIDYRYDGMGNRFRQTVNSIVTNYLLDVQPGLVQVLAESTGSNTKRNLFGLHGILAQQDGENDPVWMVQDGLGSVRGLVDDSMNVAEYRSYTPVGVLSDGAMDASDFGFAGEMHTGDLVNLRARYYAPELGMFTALDPVENLNRYQYVNGNPINDGVGEPMSLNRYSYVAGNPTNFVDPSGMIGERPETWEGCYPQQGTGDCSCYECEPDALALCQQGKIHACPTIQVTATPTIVLTAPPTNTPRAPLPTQTPMPTPTGGDRVQGLQTWTHKLLAMGCLQEAQNSPSQWEPITYLILNRFIDTLGNPPYWSCGPAATRDIRCIINGALSGWSSLIGSFTYDGTAINPLTINEAQTNYIWGYFAQGSGDLGRVSYRFCPALETVRRAVQTYGSNTKFLGLYYFANKIQNPEGERDKVVCLGKIDTSGKVEERGGIRVEYVPSEGPDGGLVLTNFVSVPVAYNGPTEECSRLP